MTETSSIFNAIQYHIVSSIPEDVAEQYAQLLNANGAKCAPLEDANYIITDTHLFEGWRAVSEREDVATVTVYWVERSLIMGKALAPSHFSPNPAMIFSGVVGCAHQVLPADCEILAGTIEGLGGQWRTGYTREVTHLFSTGPCVDLEDEEEVASDKYSVAMHHRERTNVKIITLHWFDDCVKLGNTPFRARGKPLMNGRNQWFCNVHRALAAVGRSRQTTGTTETTKTNGSPSQKAYFASVAAAFVEGKALPEKSPNTNTWGGRKVLLSTTLDLKERRLAIETTVVRAGGYIVEYETNNGEGTKKEEVDLVDDCDVYITKYRNGRAYIKALEQDKTIGNLAWILAVSASGTLSAPTTTLLHYPVPKRKIPGFDKEVITITNYTGPGREYLKKLIEIMGGTFTPSMSNDNTAVVAAFIRGTKTEKALSWGLAVINHTWLEDCFLRWKYLSPAAEKYISFPPGVDFAAYLGTRGHGSVVLEGVDLAGEDDSDEEDIQMASEPPRVTRTQGSLIDVAEVEAAVSLEDEPDAMDLDDDAPPEPAVQKKGKQREKEKSATPRKKAAAEPSPPPKAKRVPAVVASSRMKIMRAPSDDEDDFPDTISALPKKTAPASAAQARAKTKEKEKEKEKERGKEKEKEKMESPRGYKTYASPKRKIKGKGKAAAHSETEEDEEEDDDEPVVVEPKKGRAAKENVEVETEREDEPRVVVKPKSSRLTSKEPYIPPRPLDKSLSKMSLSHVEMPPPRHSPKKLAAAQSVEAVAGEASASTSRRGRASTSKGASTPPRADSAERPTLVRTPSKRSAAVAAAQKTGKMMVDKNKFEKEQKTGRLGRGDWEEARGSESVSTGRKRASMGNGTPEDEAESDDGRDKKRRRVSAQANGKGKGKARAEPEEEEEDSSEEEAPRPTRGAKTKEAPSGSRDVVSIRLLATQLTLKDYVVRELKKLGVATVSSATDATHLIASRITRTEKFLCALPRVRYIVAEKWAVDSAAAKKLLPESDYPLVDKEGEKKFGFRLAVAVENVKHNRGKLFEGHTFYITSKLKNPDPTLVKNVIAANGGSVAREGQNPTTRVMKGHPEKHIISCKEDAKVWRALAEEGYAVYKPEFVFAAAMKQEVAWDDEAERVEGSL